MNGTTRRFVPVYPDRYQGSHYTLTGYTWDGQTLWAEFEDGHRSRSCWPTIDDLLAAGRASGIERVREVAHDEVPWPNGGFSAAMRAEERKIIAAKGGR